MTTWKPSRTKFFQRYKGGWVPKVGDTVYSERYGEFVVHYIAIGGSNITVHGGSRVTHDDWVGYQRNVWVRDCRLLRRAS